MVLSAGAVMLLVVGSGYLYPTYMLWCENRDARRAEQAREQAPDQIRHLAAQARHDAWAMRSYRIDTTQHEGRLLDQLSHTCRRYGVTLAALSRGEPSVHAGYRVQMRVAKLRGSFRNLVQAVYSLEYEHPIGRLASVRFALEEDRRQRRQFLFAYLYLQSITGEVHDTTTK